LILVEIHNDYDNGRMEVNRDLTLDIAADSEVYDQPDGENTDRNFGE
jgi:hypothetical protein